jgi:hydroxymethylpyrimidine/phosphomethylpyrimidine kinase
MRDQKPVRRQEGGEDSAVPRALTIAGSDSGGGAGIQADLKTFAALGVWGMSAVTSVTVQSTTGVAGVADVPPSVVGEQIRAVLGDIGADAAKTGMLSNAEIIDQVAASLAAHPVPNLVVDPVFVSKHGDPLLRADAVQALRGLILPLASLVTPNLPEAAGLAGLRSVESRGDMRLAADAILAIGAGAVLVKGGHLAGDRAADLLALGDGSVEWIDGPRIDTPHTHGTGCTLSAAIAAFAARGMSLRGAVIAGKAFVTEAIRHGLAIGQGIGPVNPGWRDMDAARRGSDQED